MYPTNIGLQLFVAKRIVICLCPCLCNIVSLRHVSGGTYIYPW